MAEALIAVVLVSLCALVVLSVLFYRVRRVLIPKQQKERLAEMLPFYAVLDDNVTLYNKNNTYARTLEVIGTDTSTITTDEYEALVNKRHNMLLELAKQDHVLKMITTRDMLVNNTHEPKFDNEVAQKIADLSLKNKTSFLNRHFLSLVVMPDKTTFLDYLIDKLLGKKRDLNASIGKLTECVDIVTETLSNEVKLLSLDNPDHHLLKFWGKIISGEEPPAAMVHDKIDKWLANARVDFDFESGVITHRANGKARFSQIVSLNEWGESSTGDIVKELISLSFELICLQLISAKAKTNSKKWIKEERKHRKSFKAAEELDIADRLVDGGDATLFEHQLSVLIYSEDLGALERAITAIKQVFRNYGLNPIIETTAIKQIWFQLFSGNETKIRPTNLLSSNVAHLMNFHSDAVGVTESDWCNHPITYFKTGTGNYAFSFHKGPGKEVAANSLIIAPTGSGKTMLLNYLAAMSLQIKDLRIFIFDRMAGCKIPAYALAGQHIDLSGENNNLNIFYCEDNKANKLFLVNFLLNLAGIAKEDSNANTSKNILITAVNFMFKMPKEERIFSRYYDNLIPRAHPIYMRLHAWGKGEYANWISGFRMVNNKPQAFDALDFSNSARLVVIEMANILNSAELVILCEYIFYRIRSQIGGKGIPHLICVDELAQLIRNPIVRKTIISLYQEARRSRGAIYGCFQDPGSVLGDDKTGDLRELSDTLVNNAPTQIFYPNPRANPASYEVFKLTDREFNFIKGQHRVRHRLTRPILIRKETDKGMQSAIVDVDLSKSLGKYLNLIRSGGEFVEIFESVYKHKGEKWLEEYLARV